MHFLFCLPVIKLCPDGQMSQIFDQTGACPTCLLCLLHPINCTYKPLASVPCSCCIWMWAPWAPPCCSRGPSGTAAAPAADTPCLPLCLPAVAGRGHPPAVQGAQGAVPLRAWLQEGHRCAAFFFGTCLWLSCSCRGMLGLGAL